MVNTDDFIKRLEIILEYYSVSASAFADTIGVQRSALSHLMSGRNKPSLDLIMKIIEAYPEVDLYWLLNGKGSFPKEANDIQIQPKPTAPAPPPAPPTISDLFAGIENKTEEYKNAEEYKQEEQRQEMIPHSSADIEQIVVFYKDGTFKYYKPQ